MSNDANGDWVRARTPREEGDEWAQEQSEYGLAVDPDEWDDYASDQSVPVTPPKPRPRPEVVEPDPGDAVADVADPTPAEAAPEVVEPTGEELLQSPEALEHHEAQEVDLERQDVDPEQDLRHQPQETADEAEQLGPDETETVPVMVDGEPEDEFLRETGDRDDVVDTGDAHHDPDATMVRDRPLFDATDETDETGRHASNDVEHAEPTDDPDRSGFPMGAVGAAGAGAAGAAALGYGDSEPVLGRDVDARVRADLVGDPDHEPADPVTATGEVRTDDDVEDTDDQDLLEPDAQDEARVTGLGDEPTPGGEADLADHHDDSDHDAWNTADEQTRVTASVDAGHDDHPGDDRMVDEDRTRVSQGALGDEPTSHTASPGAAGAATGAGMAGIYRGDDTQVMDQGDFPDDDEREAEERRIQEQLAAERRARQERLGVVPTSPENETRATGVKPTPTTDRWYGSLGLFILRLITAGVVGVTGYQMLTPIQETVAVLESTLIPEPRLVAWIAGFTLAFLAILLVLGFAQRIVGFLLMVYGVGMLVFVRLGTFNPFREGFEGFHGDKELLLVGIGLLLLLLGGGRWGIDGAIRGSRARARAEQQHY